MSIEDEISEELLHQFPKEAQELPKEVLVQIVKSFSFSGPIPPAEMFREYEDAVQGSGSRILTMAEKNQDNRIYIERGELSMKKITMCMFFALSILSTLCAAYLTYSGAAEYHLAFYSPITVLFIAQVKRLFFKPSTED